MLVAMPPPAGTAIRSRGSSQQWAPQGHARQAFSKNWHHIGGLGCKPQRGVPGRRETRRPCGLSN